jgi:integrase/recombinase XerD
VAAADRGAADPAGKQAADADGLLTGAVVDGASFAARTQEGYVRAVKAFSIFLGASPATASAEDLRRYRLHLVESGVAAPTINHSLTALRFLLLVTLRKPAIVLDMPFVREPRRLPVVLSPQEA